MPDEPEFLDATGSVIQKMPNQIRPGVSAIIFNENGEVLLEKRSDNGFWGLPGGAVDIGESVTDAVVREVREETSLVVSVTRLVGVYSDPHAANISVYPDGNVVHWITICFECERLAGALRLSHESTDLRYFPVNALPTKIIVSHRARIHDAMADEELPFIR